MALPHLPRPIRPTWERGSFGGRLGGGPLANFIAGLSFACVLRLGAGSRKTQRPHDKFFKERGRPLAATTIKKLHGRGMQSFLRTVLQNQKLLGVGVVRARSPL